MYDTRTLNPIVSDPPVHMRNMLDSRYVQDRTNTMASNQPPVQLRDGDRSKITPDTKGTDYQAKG